VWSVEATISSAVKGTWNSFKMAANSWYLAINEFPSVSLPCPLIESFNFLLSCSGIGNFKTFLALWAFLHSHRSW
jgi:hypothetical protein